MRIVAYIVMALALATLLPWLAMAPMALMAFDSGASAMAYGVVALMLAVPMWLLTWLRQAWNSQKAGDATRAFLFSVIAAAPMLILLGVIVLGGRH